MSGPNHYKMFLQQMIPPVPQSNVAEADHVIRRAVAMFRLCYWDVPNGFEMLDEKLKQNVDKEWTKSYETRNYEKIRPMHKSGESIQNNSDSSFSSGSNVYI